MTTGIACQTLAGASQYDGTPLGGFFGQQDYSYLPRTTRVVLTSLSYTEINAGPALTTTVQFWVAKPGGDPTERMLVGEGLASEGLLNSEGNATLRLCGIVLPREQGEYSGAGTAGLFWDVLCITENKSQTATACVDSVLVPYPDASLRDSREV